jgi:hypothetical protein
VPENQENTDAKKFISTADLRRIEMVTKGGPTAEEPFLQVPDGCRAEFQPGGDVTGTMAVLAVEIKEPAKPALRAEEAREISMEEAKLKGGFAGQEDGIGTPF